ncbi:MAG TPA: RNA-binding protein [Treponema sp.]|nr:RNA-binding protein [Treponema sp.]
MGKKIYVGNLAYNTNDAEVRSLFEPFGTVVSANVITDRFSGSSKGFGFVEMESEEAAGKAIASLDGTDVDGRKIKVNEAIDKPARRGNDRY